MHSPLPLPQVLSQTESYLQQLLVRAMAVLPQWKVRVQKCKAVQMVLNLCSSSVTEKCLIAEAWCPTAKLPELQSALREGGVGQAKTAQTCRYRAGGITAPLLPLLFFFFLSDSPAEKWQRGGFLLQPAGDLDASTHALPSQLFHHGLSEHRRCLRRGELPRSQPRWDCALLKGLHVSPIALNLTLTCLHTSAAVYTIITFPFLFAVMFGDVGHGLLMTLAALWMVLEEKDPKLKNNSNEVIQGHLLTFFFFN